MPAEFPRTQPCGDLQDDHRAPLRHRRGRHPDRLLGAAAEFTGVSHTMQHMSCQGQLAMGEGEGA